MRELLLAYLFGQLESDQRQQVERALADQPELREELRQLRSCLGAVDPAEVVEPPPGLVERTCRRVIRYRPDPAESERGRGASPRGGSDCGVSMGPVEVACRGQQQCSRGDLAVALGLTFVAAMFLFPAMHDSRVMARRLGCQNNMRELSIALSLYTTANGGIIPHVPAEGPEAFAGIYPVHLVEGHFADPRELSRLVICPATIRVGEWERDGYLLGLRIPTREQLRATRENVRQVLMRELGGSYAYRIGYIDRRGRYRPWRNDRNPRSAILADAPSLHLEAFQSSNHGGRGQNVLFADGHVGYLCNCPTLACGDHLFKNRDGYRAAALGEQDNVLVRSEEGPGLRLIQALWQH